MSASAPLADSCPGCGDGLPGGARYCPSCGAAVEDPVGTTLRVEVPPDETRPGPVSFSHTEPRWFGLTPPVLLFSVTVGCFVLAIVLFASGHWPFGLILLGVAALLLAAFLELARRRPGPGAGQGRTPTGFRERAESAWEALRARALVSGEARRIQSSVVLLESERREALLELGQAAYHGDAAAEAAPRVRLADLDAREADLRQQLEERVEIAGERIRKARLPVQETVMVTPPGPSAPYPPPDEGNPPQPATVPEPYPPPDEGNPPQPAPTPEPQPREDS